MTYQRYSILPREHLTRAQSGLMLNAERGWFSLLIPVARTNLVTNPSGETGTTSWAAISGGTLSQDATRQFYGAYSFKYVPTANTTDGIRYTGALALTSGALYGYQIRFLGVGGHSYKLALTSSGNVEVASVVFQATGSWQWVYGYYAAASTATHRIAVTKNNDAFLLPFYVDGVDVQAIETGGTISTYIDGDQLGLVPNQTPPAFWWNGTPHASSSGRSGQTRAGGMIVNIQDTYRHFLTSIAGLGLSPPQHNVTEYALLDGAQYNYTRKPSRQFSLIGQLNALDPQQLRTLRADLGATVERDLIATEQPLTLRYQAFDCLREISDEAEIIAIYDGGLEGNDANHFGQEIPIHFTQYSPFIYGVGQGGASLNVQTSVANANYILERLATGAWQAVSSGTVAGASGDVNAIAIGRDGKVYVGGVFASASGVANTNSICYYDPADGLFHAMGTGVTGGSGVQYLAIDAAGNVYAVGAFTAMGGVANTKNIAKWNGAAWVALGTGVTTGAGVLAITADHLGNIYVGGTFTQMGGVANTLRLAKWDGSVWTALGTGANDVVRALTCDRANNLYIGGDFTTINGTSAIRVAKWNGSAASALSTGMDSSVFALAFSLAGILYAGGTFTTAGGVAAAGAASWNGTAWSALGTGLVGGVNGITVAPDGTIYYFGGISTANGVAVPGRVARWNGGGFVPIDSNLAATATVQALTFDAAGNFYVGYSSFGSATNAGLTTVSYYGSARTYPTITIKGPATGTARIYSIQNATTGKAVYLNYTILAGETATLIFTPDALSFASDFQGNIASTVMPGSDEDDFFLQPGPPGRPRQAGSNTILLYSSVATVTASIRWRNAYASLDDLIR